jgi:hypothetical protein
MTLFRGTFQWSNDGMQQSIAVSDDVGPVRTAEVTAPVTGGTTYIVGVDGFNDGYYSQTGSLRLSWSFTQ